MRIAVDAMGGDNAPRVVVEGAVKAAKKLTGVEIILVGHSHQIEEYLKVYHDKTGSVRVEHAEGVVAMSDSPVEALRKKGNTSIGRCAELARKGEVNALFSAGNTGAAVAAATLAMGTLEGVRKPGIAAPFPTVKGTECVVIDVGANIKPKPEHLFDYGIMAAEYVEAITGRKNPTIGLMNVGEEEAKGDDFIKQTYALFKSAPINFIGNVEGRDIFEGEVDVVVCDGFVGNVLLKTAEGTADALFKVMKQEIMKSFISKLGAWICKPAFKTVYRRLNSSAYGGAQLLGVDGICIIGHGSSDAKAVVNAITVAVELSNNHANDRVVSAIKRIREQRPQTKTATA